MTNDEAHNCVNGSPMSEEEKAKVNTAIDDRWAEFAGDDNQVDIDEFKVAFKKLSGGKKGGKKEETA